MNKYRNRRIKSSSLIPYEHDEQKRVIDWSMLSVGKYPVLKWLYAIPNGSNKSKTQAGLFKEEGLKAGVPDLCLPAPSQKHHALYIEMKRIKGSNISKEQKEWIEGLNGNGNYAVICKGADEAIQTIIDYLEGKL